MSADGNIGGGNGSEDAGGRRRLRPAGGQRSLRPAIAALDLGTNNCRLLIARPAGQDFEVVDAFSRAVRLGEGVEGTNRLSDEAQDRAVKALKICASKLRFHRARIHRNIATEACRRATNAQGFLERVTRETGLQLDVISAEEEARLAVAGCAPLIDPRAEQLLVYDIGGGSTELIWIDLSEVPPPERRIVVRELSPMARAGLARPTNARVTDWISLPMGVSTLGDRFAAISDERARFREMTAYVEQALGRFAPFRCIDRTASTRRLQIIGVSGTATTFGAIHLGLRSYNRARVDGLWIQREAVVQVADRLLDMGVQGRAAHPGIGRGRAGLVLAGAAILMTILRAWPVARMRIADRGLREGMLYGLLSQSRVAAG
ncbi:MAG: Ppx/GppA phosphatase family protein [Pikeienuella sp.]